MHPFRSMFKLFSIVNKFPKMEKLFTILNSFLIFEKFSARVDRDANILPSGIAPYKYAAMPPPYSITRKGKALSVVILFSHITYACIRFDVMGEAVFSYRSLPHAGKALSVVMLFPHMRVFALTLWRKRYSRIVAFPIGEGGPRQRWIGCSR